MGASIEPRLLRWRDTHELFNADAPLLVFLTDAIDDEWNEIPGDVLAILETMQSTAATRVRIYTADFRVDADFLSLFSTGQARRSFDGCRGKRRSSSWVRASRSGI